MIDELKIQDVQASSTVRLEVKQVQFAKEGIVIVTIKDVLEVFTQFDRIVFVDGERELVFERKSEDR